MQTLWQDLRYGARMLLKNPGFTLVAVITLALGIGANTTIFSVVNALIFRSLPYAEADRLTAVVFNNENPGQDLATGRLYWSYPKFSAFREHQTSSDAVAAYYQVPMTVNFADQPEKAEVEIVTADYFTTLGVKAALGRVFAPEEDRAPESHPVVLISHKLWSQRFGADPKVIGRTIHIKNFPYTIVGVAPAGFGGQMGTAELWAPMMMTPRLMFPEALTDKVISWKAIARLKPGVSLAQAQIEAAALTERINQLVPDPPGLRPSGTGKAKTFDYFRIGLDLRVLAFNMLLAAGAGIAFGIFPALQAAKQNVNEILKEGSGGAGAGFRSLRRPTARGALVVAQLALSLMLLAGAGLAIKSFWKLLSVKLGFDPRGVVTMSLGSEGQGLDFYQQLLERTRRLPGVESASLAAAAPLSGRGNRARIEIEGRTREETSQSFCLFNVITPDYFKTFRIAVLQGRVLNEQDRPGAPRVAVISRTTAQEFWRGENPLGRRIKAPWRTRYETNEQWIEIVGVVDDVKYGAPEDEFDPVIYLPQSQPTLSADHFALRVAGDPAPVIAAFRKDAYALNKTVPVYGASAMSERIAKVTSRYRYSAWLMGAFAALALILAAIGIYGVVSYAASARTHEIGVRITLGAQPSDIARLIIIDGIALMGAGMSFGLIAALAATRVLKSQLYGVETNDPLTFLAVSMALAVVGILACYIPARRATKVDPIVALRCE